ncbi:MAG TPA: hypothetical protein VD971_12865 [Phycisphaerales bacterium]|nr:hypothetical protein [Phycisphaerales bacterium]
MTLCRDDLTVVHMTRGFGVWYDVSRDAREWTLLRKVPLLLGLLPRFRGVQRTLVVKREADCTELRHNGATVTVPAGERLFYCAQAMYRPGSDSFGTRRGHWILVDNGGAGTIVVITSASTAWNELVTAALSEALAAGRADRLAEHDLALFDRCNACQYSLHAVPLEHGVGICPECGWRFLAAWRPDVTWML